MPQRVNSKSDIGNTKRASDVYDVNNCFLTDQGWVYRHFKGEPATTERFWDEILVAGDSDGADQIQYSTESSKGSLLVETPSFEAGPDNLFDVMYSKHTEDGVEFGDPANYVMGVNDTPPGPDPDGYVQFPSLDGSTVTANNVTAPQSGGGVSTTQTTTQNTTYSGAIAVDGYYPLYLTRTAANAAGNGSHHTHYLNGRSYYMPNGVSIWHGNYNG